MRNLLNILLRDSTRPVGLLLAAQALGYAAQLAGGRGVLGAAPVLTAMQALAPEWAWALAFGAVGALEAGALILGRHRPRIVAAFVMALLWAFVAGAAWWSTTVTLAAVTWSTFAAGSAWIFWRLAWAPDAQEYSA